MTDKPFRPTLAVDATGKLDSLSYPKYASTKFDGIRVIAHPQLGLVSRSLKPIQNKQLQEKFKFIADIAKKDGIYLDGELYSPNLTFQEITRAVMTKDFSDPKTIKKIMKEFGYTKTMSSDIYTSKLLNNIKFYCFDMYDGITDEFNMRLDLIEAQFEGVSDVVIVKQGFVNSPEEVMQMFDAVLKLGYEGLILRSPDSPYKFGRSTLKEEYMLKVKPFKSFDLKITDVIERMENLNESFKNELGSSTKRNTVADKKGTGLAACFETVYNGLPMKVTITGTEDFRRSIWSNKESFIGKMMEVKGMTVGAKDVLRHPVFLRFREDRDG